MRGSLISCLLILAVAGCGNSAGLEVTPKDAAAPDLAVVVDMSVGPDLKKVVVDMAKATGGTDLAVYTPPDGPNGVACGMQTCSVGQVCCVDGALQNPSFSCGTTCADGGFTLACDGPEDCSGNNACCVDIKYNGSLMANKTGSCGTSPTDCSFNLMFGGLQNIAITTRRCHATPECGAGATCCTANLQGTSLQLCFGDMEYKQFGGFIGQYVQCP